MIARWLPGGGGEPDLRAPRPGADDLAHLRVEDGEDEVEPSDPEIPLPYGLRASAELLRRAGPELARLPVEARIAGIARVARSWLDPDDSLRREAESVLPAELGFTGAMVRWGLDRAFEAVTAEALAAWWRRAGGGDPCVGLSAHIWSGNVFVAGVPPVCGALLAGVPALIKAPDRHPSFAALFARSLAVHAPELGPCVGAAAWSRQDETTTRALLTADVTFVFGDDATVRAVREAATGRVAGFGHRVSVGIVGADAADGALVGLLEDCLAYDGGGCLTPRWVFVVGELADAVALAGRAAGLAPGVASRLPGAALGDEAAAARAQYVGVAGFAGFARAGVGWCVAAQPGLEPAPPGRTLCFVPAANLEEVQVRLAPLAGALQGLVTDGVVGRALPALRAAGVSIVAAPGAMQRPPLDWDHDGVDILAALR